MNLAASILETQRALQRAGYAIDADGLAGVETWTALRDFALSHTAASAAVPIPPVASAPARGSIDQRSAANLATLLPAVRPYASALLHAAAQQGITIRILDCLRTYAEQDALYARGRTAPGPKVTNARGGFSNHNFGLAFDIGVFLGGQYLEETPAYKAVAALGKGLGLEWGGDWHTIHDEPHFQLRPTWARAMNETAFLAELRRRHEARQPIFA